MAAVGEACSFRPITNAIFTGVVTYRNERKTRFIKDLIKGVDDRVCRLEQKIDQGYINTDDYTDFLYKTLRMAFADLRKEKLNLFANIIANAALIGNADEKDVRKYLYDETIDKIDEKLFGFLLRLYSREMSYGSKRNVGWRGDDNDLKQLCVDEKTFFFMRTIY